MNFSVQNIFVSYDMNHVEEDEDRGSVENNGNTFLLKIHVLTDFFF